MSPITFYPGPSKLYPSVEQYLQEAYQSGILSANHRSQLGMDLLRDCINVVKEKLAIPAQYEVFLFSSATECWEVIAQSLTQNTSTHIYNGAFGQKWEEYTAKLVPKTTAFANNDPNQAFNLDHWPNEDTDILCLTQNETANGSQISMQTLAQIREIYQQLIAVDVTSSLGGIVLDWPLADVWFGSVQKCLGLPAGLALMVCSPAAIAKAQAINNRQFYNSLLFVKDNFDKFQTPYTPNMLGIYLLKRVMEDVLSIETIAENIKNRAKNLYTFFEENPVIGLKALIENAEFRSDTVLTLSANPDKITAIKSACAASGITLGNGYGQLKNETLRIANFPAINDQEFEKLKTFLKSLAL